MPTPVTAIHSQSIGRSVSVWSLVSMNRPAASNSSEPKIMTLYRPVRATICPEAMALTIRPARSGRRL